MGLSLGFGMGLTHPVALEGQAVAGVGISEDGADRTDGLLGQAIDGKGAVDALVSDMVGHDPALPSAVGGPDDRPLLFF